MADALATDRRWRSGVGHLARRIAESEILDDDELDLLAAAFVAAGDAVYWQVPDHWFSDDITITLGPGQPGDEAEDIERDDEPEGPTARREVPPPLRRWATAHMTRRDPDRWAGLFARAAELGARHGPRSWPACSTRLTR